MNKSIILDLVFDGRAYGDNITMKHNEDYCKCNDDFYKMIEELCKDMPEEQKQKLLFDLSMAQSGLEANTADEYFKQGFKLGLIIAAQNLLD